MIRLIKITGWTNAARENRLKAVADWMGGHGWEMTDFSAEAGSAFFERAAGAPRLGWFDPTRWLPGPVSWRPWEWWTAIWADPRLLLPPALLTVLVVAVVMVASAPGLQPPALPGPASGPKKIEPETPENWWVVTSGRLNVREAPTTLSQVVGILYKDQRVLVRTETDADWVEIELPERGFVARKYVRTQPGGAAEKESP